MFQIKPEVAVTKQKVESESEEEWAEEEVETPIEVEVVELVEREVMKDEVVEKRVPQVKALYPYKGQGLQIDKGEVRLPSQFLNLC